MSSGPADRISEHVAQRDDAGQVVRGGTDSKLPDNNNYEPAATLVHCNPKFDQIIRKAMHPTPVLRYRSAEAMAEAIESIANEKKSSQGKLLQPSSKPTSSTARTLLTAAPSSKKPEVKTAFGSGNKNSPTPTPATSNIKVGSNEPFIRNIIIIIGLLAIIYIAWEGLKIVQANRVIENERVSKLNEQKKKVR